jgi:hypothetical protein
MAKPQKKQQLNQTSAVVKPAIRSNEEKHLLEEIFEGPEDEMPEIKSVGFSRIGNSNNSWVSYTITTKGKKVISFEVDEPNLREVAEEGAKIAFVTALADQGLM